MTKQSETANDDRAPEVRVDRVSLAAFLAALRKRDN